MRPPSWLVLALVAPALAAAGERPRARDLGIAPGVFPTGPLNAITDVDGVRVGHVTLRDETTATGVTAIVPHGGNVFEDKVAAGVFVGNAFGKLAGSTQVEELGTLETPIVLTNTLAVGTAVEALVAHALEQPGNEDVRSVNAVVGETNDGWLNDIRARPVTVAHVREAVRSARSGPVEEGSVGAGTGTRAFGWKGGIGTASRVLPDRLGGWTLGVLVQVNYGGLLTIDGVPVGRELGADPFGVSGAGDGSCMIVVATDAPLDARALTRIAARAIFALARTGSSYSNGSGDYALAFSAAPASRSRHGVETPAPRTLLPADALSPLFQATLEATEEAVDNALLRATTVTANGRTVEALPVDRVRAILAKYGRER